MVKKLLSLSIIVFALLFLHSFMIIEYDMNLYEYLSSNTSLTEDEIAYLNAHGPLIYGADQNSPPLRYVNKSSGQYEGFVIDYLRALSIELGTSIEFKPLIWNEALNQLENGETDFCDMYFSKERSKKFLFSDPIYYQRGAILVKKSNKSINGVEDLEGKVISGSKGDYIFEYIEKRFRNVEGIETDDLEKSIELLTDDKIDAVLGDESVMNYFLTQEQLNSEYVILDDYLYEKEAVFGCNKDDPRLVEILNKAINSLNKKKTMEKIYQKWFGISPLITKGTSADKMMLMVKYIILMASIIGFALYSWNRQLKKEVDKKTNALNISKNELETVFNGLTHLLAVVDSDCFVTDANKAFCQKYSMTLKEIRQSHCKSIKGILGTDCNSCVIRESFEKQSTAIKEVNSEGRIYKVSTYLLDKLDISKQRVLVMMEDVTDFKITEQKMLQSTKLAAIGQLAAGIAHEIRTPLSIIRSHSYYLKRSDSEDERLESMDVIENSVAKASVIIDNLLNFSRLTDNTISLQNIYGLISELLELNNKSFRTKKISTELICPEDFHFPVNGESLKHIIINLLNNSADAMPEGGKIEIKVTSHNNEMSMTISDTGIGMTKEVLDNIFNPFFTTKPHGKGTGLGLYITYNEVQKMDGTLKVESTPKVGTTFTMTIPNLSAIEDKDKEV